MLSDWNEVDGAETSAVALRWARLME